MKTNAILVIVIIILALLICNAIVDRNKNEIKFLDSEVVYVEKGLITCVDAHGEAWQFYGSEFQIGDFIRLTVQDGRVTYAYLIWRVIRLSFF